MSILDRMIEGLEKKYDFGDDDEIVETKPLKEGLLNESQSDKEKFAQFAGKALADRFEYFKSTGKIKGHEKGDYTYWMDKPVSLLRQFLHDVESGKCCGAAVDEGCGKKAEAKAITEAVEDTDVQALIGAAREATDAAAEEVMNELDSDDDNILMAAQDLLFYASITVALVDHANEECVKKLASEDGVRLLAGWYDTWKDSDVADVTDNTEAWEFIQGHCDSSIEEDVAATGIGKPLTEADDETQEDTGDVGETATDTSAAKSEVQQKVKKEYEDFFENYKTNKGYEDVNQAQKLVVLALLSDAIENGEIADWCYAALQDEDSILSLMYDEYLEHEFEFIDTGEDAVDFIENYCERFHPEYMEEGIKQVAPESVFNGEGGHGIDHI